MGDAYDNAMAESFFTSLECELIDRRAWKNKTEARLWLYSSEPGPGITQLVGILGWGIYHLTILKEN